MANSKDVVITGVSTGIGWGTTKVLTSKGFRVFGSVRKQADADRLQSEFGNGFVPLIMDITDADAIHHVGGGEDVMQSGRLTMDRVFWCERRFENADRSDRRGAEGLDFYVSTKEPAVV